MEQNQKNNCFKSHWQEQGNAKMPMFRCFGAFVVFIVSGLFEYCGTINREKRTREKGEEHITQDKKNMAKYNKQEEQGHQK